MRIKFKFIGWMVGVLLLLAGEARAQVLISEFMAANDHGLQDEDGQCSDWIELYNAGATPVNLGGWFLTDDETRLTKWAFPTTNLNAHGFLTVFASNKDRRVPGAPLHTNFKLDADGEYLALIKPDGVSRASEFAPKFPQQYSDVAYGIGQTTTLLASNAPARVLIPTSGTLGLDWVTNTFSDAGWIAGANGVGYETTVPGFAVRVVKANVYVESLAAADTVLATPAQQAAVYGENAPVINYFNSGGSGNYGNDRPFPGLVDDVEDFVVEATATVTIPKAGAWTFGVNSDDGFRLNVGSFSMAYPDPRGPDSTLQTFNFPAAGQYQLRLVFYERGGGSEVELWAASGMQFWWDDATFRLVGDTAKGGLAVVSTPVAGGGSYRPDIRTDVQSAMLNQQVSAYVRLPFTATKIGAFESLTLKIKYDDGFVAYLNGVRVASRNAPATPAWNTPATAAHGGGAYEFIDLSASLEALREGDNLLAIHGLNQSAASTAFLELAELVEYRIGGSPYAYLSPATPSLANVAGYPALAAPVQFSLRGGVYTTNLLVALFSPTPGATIRYTLNNKLPTATSTLYTGPVAVRGSVGLRARAFAAGYLPSPPTTEAYTLLAPDLVGFNSKLPLLILNAYGQTITPDLPERVPATFTVIDTWKPSGRATLLGRPDYHGRAGVEGRGQTSWGFPKKPYNVELRGEDDQAKDHALLGMPAESDWVLLNVYNDKSFMNDFLAHELFAQMGHYAVRRRYVEVFLNGTRPEGGTDPSDKLSYDDYVGIYLLLEKIKIGKDRVALARLAPTDSTEPDISGGYIFKKDKDSPGDANFTTSSGQFLKFHDPRGAELTAGQRNWLVNYLNRMEGALYGANWRDPVNGYAKYLDADSFVDNHWIVEFTKQIDGYRLSNYLQKDRGGKVKMEPIWDWNLSFGNADYLDCQYPEGWYWPLLGAGEHIWLRRLIAEPGDPDFNQKIIDRWSVLRTKVLDATTIVARMDEIATLLDEAQARDFQRWPRLGSYVWPNPPGLAAATTYAEVLDWVKNWLWSRYAWIDSQYLPAPTLSLPGGPIDPGTGLTVSAPAGTIYYKLDGSDPRARGGGIAAGAVPYAGPITLSGNARVVARAKSGSDWSGPAAATYYTQIPRLVVTEIMYHPAGPPAGSTNVVDDFQFIELRNGGTQTLSLAGFRFTRGVEFTFASGSLGPGARIVLVSHRTAFESRYGLGPNLAGVFMGTLAHGGERVTLLGPLEEPVLDFVYGDTWEPITDGYGFSLVIANDQAPLDTWNDPASWRRSGNLGGSPGAADSPRPVQRIVINEILTNSDPPQTDSIELYNPTDQAVDISHWLLTDDRTVPAKFRVPAGWVIPAGAYLVLNETHFNPMPGVDPSFALDATGEEVCLFSADAAGRLTGHLDGFPFGAAAVGVTFGRYTNNVGALQFPAQSRSTLGDANAGPRIGPVVISEIGYAPAVEGDEFIELKNLTDQPVKLYDPSAPTNTWRVRGVGFEFPGNTVLAPCGLALVVGGDPASFRTRHHVPTQVPIFGPYSGALENHGEGIELQRPDPPVADIHGVVSVPYVTVDAVHYNDEPPWPAEAAGFGRSLERITASAYGNDPTHWRASAPTATSPGLDNAGPQPPVPPQIESVTLAPGATPMITIRFLPAAQQGYVVQYRDSLSAGTWQTLTVVAPQSPVCPVVVQDPIATNPPRRYYRVVATSPGLMQ